MSCFRVHIYALSYGVCLSLSDLALLTMITSRSIQPQVAFFRSFYGRVVFQCIYGPRLVYPFICHGHLGCFRVLAIVNRAAVNAGVHVSFPVRVLSGYMPRVGLPGHMATLVF